MRLIKHIGFFLLLIFGLNACAPRPVFRLQSLGDQSTWYQGTEYIHSTADSVTVTVAYIRHTREKVIFDVEVSNYSDEIARVDPVYFTYQAFKSRTANRSFVSGRAINPESKLLQIDMEISDEEADQKTMLVFAAIGATAIVAEEIADNDEEEEDDYNDEVNEAAATHALIAGTAAGIENSEYEVGSLRYKRERWTNETLRKTDLFPGEYINGKVYFPIAEDAKLFQIKIKTGNTIHTFRFRQLKFKP